MFFVGKLVARWINPGDTGLFVLSALFVVPSIGLLIGFVQLATSCRGGRRAAGVIAAFVAFLLVALMVLFIVVGVGMILSGFDGF
jgi:hypothetical protein